MKDYKMNLEEYNYIDIFSGIGGFALGAYMAGVKFKKHFAIENNKYCIELYQKRFPDSIQLGDITKINIGGLLKQYGKKWITTGGFPCQDISIAGKGAGIIEGERSGLWFNYRQIIRDLRPEIAIMENVSALSFRGLDTVLGSLAEIGYNAEWQNISAEEVGAPHKRERLWIVAYPINSSNTPFRREEEKKKSIQSFYRKTGCPRMPSRTGSNPEDVANTMCSGSQGHGTQYKLSTASQRKKIGRNSSCPGNVANSSNTIGKSRWPNNRMGMLKTEKKKTDYGAWRDFDQWSVEPSVGRLVNGLSGRVDRLTGLGNAIVPQIAKLLFEYIKKF